MQACKPGSVPAWRVSIINLGWMLPNSSNDLPTNIGRAALHALAYLVFQLPRFTKIPVAREARELLPHVFTLIPIAQDGLFSVALAIVQVFIPQRLPVRKRDALCCPDFPLFVIKRTAIEQLAFEAKIVKRSLGMQMAVLVG